MSKLPNLSFTQSDLYWGKRNEKGQLCNIYTPLLNLAAEDTGKLGDFTTEKLNFDMEHPVDILFLDSYDGAVNMILNDGKNRPRLINSRFSVQDLNTFKIPDHSGFKDTNIYDENTFNVDTQLKAIPIQIPLIKYKGLIDNGGKLSCGLYSFYFKLADADGNETEVIAESGIVQCHIGTTCKPGTIRMGLENENSSKAIQFELSNIDAGFDYIHVLYSKSSSGEDLASVTTYHKIIFDYPVDKDGKCNITITGAENIIGISKEECNVNYADINSVKTQTINNNVLLFGNIDTPEHDWDAIKRFTWKIIPRIKQMDSGEIGSLNEKYEDGSNVTEEYKYCYYNTKNVYEHVGYWPDELYRFGIVYIFEDNSLSPVINLLGIDFSTIQDLLLTQQEHNDWTKLGDALQANEYEKLFFTFDTENKNRYPEYLYETDDCYFNKQYRTNSRGVIKFPTKWNNTTINVINCQGLSIKPRPLYIQFDLSFIGYKYAIKESGKSTFSSDEVMHWTEVLKKHKIKGYFFVRQKRVPTILGQGVIIGHTIKEHGSIPVIKNDANYIVLPFLNTERLLLEEALDYELAVGATSKINGVLTKIFDNLAMLCPDAEISEATYNLLFTSNNFSLYKLGNYSFIYDSEDKTSNINSFLISDNQIIYNSKLTNIPENTKIKTNGVNYFSTLAGNPNEAYKTIDIQHPWKWTAPLYLTISTTLLRGQWGPYVGLSNPNEKDNTSAPFYYGDIYNIKQEYYKDPETATDLDFTKLLFSTETFFSVSDRLNIKYKTINNNKYIYNRVIDVFRGDCFISLFTHRMFRNFIDPELPTNTTIIDPSCWQRNYGVRCTASVLTSAHSNLTGDNDGWYIEGGIDKRDRQIQCMIYFLTGNILGFVANLVRMYKDLADQKIEIDEDGEEKWIEKQYPDGFANEIVLAFEVCTKGQNYNKWNPLKTFYRTITKSSKEVLDEATAIAWMEPQKKKVNPKEQELQGGFNLKAIFKSDDNWELRGLASINRADVNAVAMGQWITFPICSNKNLSFRDVDYSNATEEASFNEKRSFYPLNPKNIHSPLRDSNVINQASAGTIPAKSYMPLQKVPYFKLEYFTRINNSIRDSAKTITNEFKMILESSYYDYTKEYGSITKLESVGNYVYIIFKHGIGVVLLNTSGTANEFLTPPVILSPMYGSLWKDSIIKTPTGIYGVDSIAKIIWKIENPASQPLLNIISDMKVGKFLIDNLDMSEFEFTPVIGHINIKSHYNAFKRDVMFTYYNDLLFEFPEGYTSKDYTIDEYGFVCKDSDRVYKFNEPVIATRQLPKYNKQTSTWESYSDIISNILLKKLDYYWVKGTNWSLCWNEDLKMFLTFYDWIPIESANIDNIYFSFDKNGIDDLKENIQLYILTPTFYEKRTNTSKKPILSKSVSNALPSIASSITIGPIQLDLKLGLSLNKQLIDSAFTNTTKVYKIKKEYVSFVTPKSEFYTQFDIQNSLILQNKQKVFSFYLKFPDYDLISENELKIAIEFYSNNNIINTIEINTNDLKYSQFHTNEWIFVPIFIKNISAPNLNITKIIIKNLLNNQNRIYNTYWIAEPKFMDYYDDNIIYDQTLSFDFKMYPINKINGLFTEYYDLRTTDNSLKLWKHGLAGVYDNQGKIKPCNWYGKLHEFNFEFVVNQNASILKIFNNLKIISNKTEPYKFEYEIVGEGYDWFKLKPIILWLNEKVKNGYFPSLDEAYYYLLTTKVIDIRTQYSDFPKVFGLDETLIIQKIPYMDLKLTDKKGLPDKDKSYMSDIAGYIHQGKDAWTDIKSTDSEFPPRLNDYKFNTNELTIVEDLQLNEYRLHDELYCNDMKKYGRIRGNMEYLEDLWDIEIRPLPIIWAKLGVDPETQLQIVVKELTETRHRDKYIKVKVRYSGEDLAVILAIQTMFDYSFA